MSEIRKYTQAQIEKQIEEQGNETLPSQESLLKIIEFQKSLKTIRKFINDSLHNSIDDINNDFGIWDWTSGNSNELTNEINKFNKRLGEIFDMEELAL